MGQSRQEQDREKGMDRRGVQEGEGPAHGDCLVVGVRERKIRRGGNKAPSRCNETYRVS